MKVWDLHAITDSIHLGSAPTWKQLMFGVVVATVALTGIEAASGLAGEVRLDKPALKRLVVLGTITILVWFVAISIIALMAQPVHGTHTALAATSGSTPRVLGVVSAYEPSLASRRAPLRGRRHRHGRAGLGPQRRDARPVAAGLRAGHQPPDPQRGGAPAPAPLDAVRGHRRRRGARRSG